MTPRTAVGVAAAGLALLGGGYAFGRFSAPDKVVTVTKTERVEVESTAQREEIDSLRVQLAESKKRIHRERVAVVAPDGTRTTTTKTDVAVDTTTSTKTEAHEEAAATHTEATATSATATKEVVRARPSVRVGLLGGVNLQTRAYAVGGQVELRVLGPLSAGVWGLYLSPGVAAGLSLGVEF